MHTCPVCFYGALAFDPADQNYDICHCCGTEFGVEDAGGFSYEEIRAKWVAAGSRWFSSVVHPPVNWDAVEQLLRRGSDQRD
jgi:uncharacterized protein (DUF983 family)